MLGAYFPNNYYFYQPSHNPYMQYGRYRIAMLMMAAKLQNYFRLVSSPYQNYFSAAQDYYYAPREHPQTYYQSNPYNYHPSPYYSRRFQPMRTEADRYIVPPVYTKEEEDRIWQEAIEKHQNSDKQTKHDPKTATRKTRRIETPPEEKEEKFKVTFSFEEISEHTFFLKRLKRNGIDIDEYVENESNTDIKVSFKSEQDAIDFMDGVQEVDPELFSAVRIFDGKEYRFYDPESTRVRDRFASRVVSDPQWQSFDKGVGTYEIATRSETQTHQILALLEKLPEMDLSEDCSYMVMSEDGENVAFRFQSKNDDDNNKLREWLEAYSPETLELLTGSSYEQETTDSALGLAEERDLAKRVNQLYVQYCDLDDNDFKNKQRLSALIMKNLTKLEKQIQNSEFQHEYQRRDHYQNLLHFSETLEQRQNPEKYRFSKSQLPQAIVRQVYSA